MKESNITVEDYRTGGSYDIAYFSGIGKRDSQQDAAYLYADDGMVFALLCDGMGGVEGGQQASQTAIDSFADYLHHQLNRKEGLLTGWVDHLKIVDDQVFRLRDNLGKREGPGTTLALAYINEDKLYWLSVGDSRIYVSRGSELVQATTDHNYFILLNQKLSRGEITEAEVDAERKRGDALISFVGMGGLLLIDVNDSGFSLMKGDTVLICSDGLYKSIPGELLRRAIQAASSASELSGFLQNAVLSADLLAQDNYTYLIIRRK